jgi:hypothetical protein
MASNDVFPPSEAPGERSDEADGSGLAQRSLIAKALVASAGASVLTGVDVR